MISAATASDLDDAVAALGAAFAGDPITGYLLGREPGHGARVTRFFSLLMRARLALGMPVLMARDGAGIRGAAMGYATQAPPWPEALARDWDRFEQAIPGLPERLAVYDAIAERGRPPVPHYYLGVIGVDPACQGHGIGGRLLQAFCELSVRDPTSGGVYLETATPTNVRFYERAGFVETGRGRLGDATLWCLFLAT